jgi:hypothetical protein
MNTPFQIIANVSAIHSMRYIRILITIGWVVPLWETNAAVPPGASPVASSSWNLPSVRLFTKDRKLRSHPFRVFATHPVTEAMHPKTAVASFFYLGNPATRLYRFGA